MTLPRSNILLAILVLAFVVRLALSLSHPFYFDDSRDYHALADNLLHHHIYQIDPDHRATRMPGYPFLLAALGNSANAMLILQSLLSAAIVYLVYLLAKPVSQTVALLAALLAAFDPLSIAFSASILSETPFTLLLIFAACQSLRIVEKPTLIRFLILAITWSAAVYLRGSLLWCIIPLLAAILFFNRKSKMKEGENRKFSFTLLSSLFTLLFVLASLLPWQLRNYSLFHEKFFRLTTLEGISLYEAVYPEATGGPRQDKIPLPPEMIPLNESQRDAQWSRRAWHEITNNPGRILRLAPIKLERLWSPIFNSDQYARPALQIALALWHIPLYLLALLGIRRTPNPLKTLLLVPILYFSLLHSLFMGSVRYRVPLMPLICLLAAFGLLSLFKRTAKPDTQPLV